MRSLCTIQKTCRVFRTLALVAMILSFLSAASALAGLFFVLEWQSSGTMGFGRQVMELAGTHDLELAICTLLSDAVCALTGGILFLSAWGYFREEQAAGTPFTLGGARKIKNLGIQVIVLNLVAEILSGVIYSCFDRTAAVEWSNAASVVLGVLLILVSLVFRYGADLEAQGTGMLWEGVQA